MNKQDQQQYFQGCIKVDQIKARYKELVKQHHPDLGGDEEIMKLINGLYESLLKSCDGTTVRDSEGNSRQYRYSEEEMIVAEKLREFLSKKIPMVEIEMIGSWLWVSGETKQSKDIIKEMAFRWHSTKKVWYFTASKKRYFKSSGKSLDEIRNTYGSRGTFYGQERTE